MRLPALLCCLLLVTSVCYAQNTTESKTDQFVWEQLEKYSPSSFRVMKTLYSLPEKFELNGVRISLSSEQAPNQWVSDNTDRGIMESINTVVHECMHGFTARYAYFLLHQNSPDTYISGDTYSAFYINENEVHLVKHDSIFSSNRIAGFIPKELKTFRYNPYISPKNNQLGSQVSGIFGLMDEWNAYYHGTKASFDLFDYYKEKASDDQGVYLEHVSNLAGTYYAHYEFKYFILKYLEFARSYSPKIYDSLLANEPLRKAFTSISDAYDQLIAEFETRLNDIAIIAQKADRTTIIYREKGYYFINGTGVGLFSKEADLLKKELSSKALLDLDRAFRLK